MIYVVIPIFNARPFLEDCLGSLARQTHKEFRVIVVDDGSKDGSSELIRERFPDTLLLQGTGDWWWTRSMNEGVKHALTLAREGDFLLSLNIDLRVDPDYLANLAALEAALRPCVVGSVNVDQDHPDRTVFAGVNWNPWTARYKTVLKPVALRENGAAYFATAMLPGRGTLFPLEAFRKAGFYDDRHMPQYAADEDMSLRARKAGYRLVLCPGAVVRSNVRSTGLNFMVSGQASPRAFWKSLWSIRSPFYLKARLHFSLAHGRIGPLYFLLDTARICLSFARFAFRQAFRSPASRPG